MDGWMDGWMNEWNDSLIEKYCFRSQSSCKDGGLIMTSPSS